MRGAPLGRSDLNRRSSLVTAPYERLRDIIALIIITEKENWIQLARDGVIWRAVVPMMGVWRQIRS